MSRTKIQKKAAKARNRAKRALRAEPDNNPQRVPRIRRNFLGKTRSGLELKFTFSGDPISVEQGREVESLSNALAERCCPANDQPAN